MDTNSPIGGGNFKNSVPSSQKTRSFWKLLVALGAIVFLFVAYVIWAAFFSPEAVSERETRKNYEQAMKSLSEYEEMMRSDTYGGKTPQETLDMFIDALEKEDFELASKYFAFETGGRNAFSNDHWKRGLEDLHKAGKMNYLILALKNVKPLGYRENYTWYKKAFNFEAESENREKIDVILVLNHLSGVWKIESL